MEQYTAIAVTRIDGKTRHWHERATGVVQVEGQEALWDGRYFRFLGTAFGLDQTCVAVILEQIENGRRVGYKVYTDTPAHGATISKVLQNLEKTTSWTYTEPSYPC